ncbi:MAG: DUF5916 domain-containing protein [Myxococcota bacterium]
MDRVRSVLCSSGAAVFALLLPSAGGALAAGTPDVGAGPLDPGPAFTRVSPTERPRLRIERAGKPPIIDGRLDEAVWEGAPTIRRLAQVEPSAGAPPSESTEIRILYDKDFLYLGIRCYDREPEAILAREMVRDVSLTSDDRVSIVVDTFHDQKNGFLFSVNPLGSRWDALIEPGPNFRDEWDGIWYAKAEIDEKGWSAEVAIPFQTLPFDPEGDTWGFNVMRAIRRRNEVVRWASPTPDLAFTNLAGAGTIEGLHGLEQGLGLDVKPLYAATYREDRQKDDTDRLGQPSLDVVYRVTPSLTSVLTFNTDFSEAPVDDRQVNLGRFSLFFPETRDFFLEDAGQFEFGGLQENGRPFFSRRIGLRSSGKPVDLDAGAKVTGRVGRLGVGILDVQASSYDDVSSQNLGVARLTYDFLGESFLGAIFTNGDPTADENNAVGGVDLRLRNSHFRGDRVLAADLWVLRSSSEGKSNDELAYGARIEYPNDAVRFSLEYQELQENYRPALGFVNRVGIRRVDGNFRYRVRPEGGTLRKVDAEVTALAVTDTDGNVESAEIVWDLLRLESQLGDTLTLTYSRRREDLVETFEISGGVVLPPSSYAWDRGRVALKTTPARVVSVEMSLGWGEFFSGTRFESTAMLQWRPSRHLRIVAEYEQNDIRLDEGNFSTRLAVLRINASFTPDLSWTTLTQYDNVSDTLGIQSRIRWIVEPGDDLWLIVNQGYLASKDHLSPTLSDFTFKVGYTFRF